MEFAGIAGGTGPENTPAEMNTKLDAVLERLDHPVLSRKGRKEVQDTLAYLLEERKVVGMPLCLYPF